jgi:hypothetical protein
MKREIVMGTVLLLPLIAAAADFQPLAVKPGLWEATMTSKVQLPDAMLANVPPERRAQMEAMMAGRGGQATVVKSCLTKDSLSRPLNFNNDARKTCQYNLVAASSTKQEVDIQCTAKDGKSTVGKMTFEVLSPESGRATMQMTQDGGTKMNLTINTRYLGPDCGDVKPR